MNEAKPQPQGRDQRATARIIAIVVLLALLVAFVVDNTRRVTVGFVFFDRETRLIFVFIATAAIGALLDRLWLRHRRS
jgi:uncharacterized integral membrane protein